MQTNDDLELIEAQRRMSALAMKLAQKFEPVDAAGIVEYWQPRELAFPYTRDEQYRYVALDTPCLH